MNISTVNELIASLESAGELSIREQKFLKLAKAFKHLAAENVALKAVFSQGEIPSEAVDAFMETAVIDHDWNETSEWSWVENETEVIHAVLDALKPDTPATDRIVARIKADGRAEGAHFVTNRMLAAWDAGFIEDTAKNAADIARMILTSTEFMADAPEGDFDRSFSDGILEDIAQQLREGADK
ncbi:ead/Ea22-like family protein [Klebsiella pneumoniae]|uniref:ead/Ea22-like family protein n=1 Tax=Klebsiella pneumoniae TaxID=573 RepID=UPI002DBA2F23|nr:ead/Ea22-like family protein [Klebsiella pneumoniae]MEC4501860.1 ead/Ea22-like family protein [Klebsiella pneumoniae]